MQEDLVHRLDCQIQPPFLAIDCDMAVAAADRRQPQLAHNFVGDILAHVAVIGVIIVQAELFHAIIIAAVCIIIEIDLEAVAVGIGIGNRGQAGVAFCANRNIIDRFAIDRDIRTVIFLRQGIFQNILPIRFVDFDVDFIDRALLKEMLGIGHLALLLLRAAHRKIRRRAKKQYRHARKQYRFI